MGTSNFPKLAKKANEIITDFETNFEHFKKHYVDNIGYNVSNYQQKQLEKGKKKNKKLEVDITGKSLVKSPLNFR